MKKAEVRRNINMPAPQKTLRFVLFLLFPLFTLFCARTPPPAPQKTPDQTIQDLLDGKASCSIPSSAQIIHLPQVHKHPAPLSSDLPKKVLNFFHDTAARSQFLIAHILKEHPSHIVFNEGSRFIVTQNSRDDITYTISDTNNKKTKLNFQDLADIFNRRLPVSYDSLNSRQKNVLLELGAAPIALSLDHIQVIHRTHNPSEAQLIGQLLTQMWNSQNELKLESHDLYKRILEAEENEDEETLKELQREAKELSEQRITLEEASGQIIIDKREDILSREVHFFLENNPSRKVFIIYGAAHDLSDDFSESFFYTLPHKCTMPESFLTSPEYARHLTSWAHRIFTDHEVLYASHIQDMKILYKTSYRILRNSIEKHLSGGGDKEDPSPSWNPSANDYLTYAELESIAEAVYVQMTALEDLTRSSELQAKKQ